MPESDTSRRAPTSALIFVIVALIVHICKSLAFRFDGQFAPLGGLVHPLFEALPIWQTSKYAQSLPVPDLPNV